MAKTKEVTIHLCFIPLKTYRMPDGTYYCFAEAVTSAVGKLSSDLIRFLNSESLQALPFRGYRVDNTEVVGDKPIPKALATSYWLFEACQGNEKAQALVQACMAESIERRLN